MRRASFNKIEMKKLLFIFLGISVLFSCSRGSKTPEYRTHSDAENEFVSSLTAVDTTAMLGLTDKFMNLVKDGNVEEAVDMITVLSQNVVYKPSDRYYLELVNRFRSMQIDSFTLLDYFFTTEGNNDVCYLTESNAVPGADPIKFKITFNPIKVDGEWYLALKDGNQSSKLLPKDKQIHDMAPAPESIRLNTRPSEQ